MRPARTVIAVDPGTAKCGIAVVRRGEGDSCAVLHREVAEAAVVANLVSRLVATYGADVVLLGDATGGRAIRAAITAALGPSSPPLIAIPEAHTSRLARERYLRENTPSSLLARLLPIGLRTPDRPYDDYVALILAEKYFATEPA